MQRPCCQAWVYHCSLNPLRLEVALKAVGCRKAPNSTKKKTQTQTNAKERKCEHAEKHNIKGKNTTENTTYPKTMIIDCSENSGALCSPPRGRQNTPDIADSGNGRSPVFRVCRVFECLLAPANKERFGLKIANNQVWELRIEQAAVLAPL